MGWSIEQVHELTKHRPVLPRPDPQLVEFEDTLCDYARSRTSPAEVLFEAKQLGYSDAQLANLSTSASITPETILKVRAAPQAARHRAGLQARRHLRRGVRGRHAVLLLDVRAAGPRTGGSLHRPPTGDDEIRITDKQEGRHPRRRPQPHRPGHRVRLLLLPRRLRRPELGFESVMINSNPETVSTRLRHQRPAVLRAADARGHAEHHRAAQRHARWARLADGTTDRSSGSLGAWASSSSSAAKRPSTSPRASSPPACPIIGTSVDSIDRAEDRDRFDEVLDGSSSSARPRHRALAR
jgi:hypothetical protein